MKQTKSPENLIEYLIQQDDKLDSYINPVFVNEYGVACNPNSSLVWLKAKLAHYQEISDFVADAVGVAKISDVASIENIKEKISDLENKEKQQ